MTDGMELPPDDRNFLTPPGTNYEDKDLKRTREAKPKLLRLCNKDSKNWNFLRAIVPKHHE
jgi:hypothetical protein